MCMWTAAAGIIFNRVQMKIVKTNINVNNICLIQEKLNKLKWNAFLEENNVNFHSKEINQKVFE